MRDLLFGSDSGTLQVYMRSGPSKEELMFSSSSSGNTWSRFSKSVERTKPFQVSRTDVVIIKYEYKMYVLFI